MIDRSDLPALVEVDAEPTVSIYLPVIMAAPDHRQNALRLKNLVRQAEEELARQGHDPAAVLKGLERLPKDERIFDDPDTEGGVVFCAGDDMRIFAVPGHVEEMVAVQRGFHVAPLFRVLDAAKPYFALALSQDEAQLYRGNAHSLSLFESEVIEASLAEIRERTEMHDNAGFYPSGPVESVKGGPPASFRYAQGESVEDYRQIQIERFAHGVARAVSEALHNRNAPLVAVAEPNILGMFRKWCQYPGLMDEAVTLSPGDLSVEDIHRLTLPIADRERMQPREEALNKLREGLGRGDETAIRDNDLLTIAAEEGRIDTLFLGESTVFPRAGETVPPSDLPDRLARLVIAQRGEIRVVADDALVDADGTAALLRY